MKKLLTAVAVVAIASVSSAATFDWAWTAKAGRLYDGTGENNYAGTGYLINSASLSQATLLAAFYDTATTVDANYLAGKALSTGTFSSGRMNGSSFTMEAASEFDAYFVVLSGDGKGIYFSDTPTFNIQPVGTSQATFASQKEYSSSFKTANAAYSGAGWYAVPEPTSGLLLLLGVAGLALKRKRA